MRLKYDLRRRNKTTATDTKPTATKIVVDVIIEVIIISTEIQVETTTGTEIQTAGIREETTTGTDIRTAGIREEITSGTEIQTAGIREGITSGTEIQTAGIREGITSGTEIQEIIDRMVKRRKFLPTMIGLAQSVTTQIFPSEKNATAVVSRRTAIPVKETITKRKTEGREITAHLVLTVSQENLERQEENQQIMPTTEVQNRWMPAQEEEIAMIK